MTAPFPWFGGKSRCAHDVWAAFGTVQNYVEPFFGSGAVLLNSPLYPHDTPTETVNDKDGYIANFWRAIGRDPEAVAHYADWPVNENDLHARHIWLVNQKSDFVPKLDGDPDFYDAKIAGYWVWGISAWIGSHFCSGTGKWNTQDGKLGEVTDGRGVHKQLPQLGNAGRGVHKQRPHLGAGQGVHKKRPHLSDAGTGVHKKRPHLRGAGMGVHKQIPLLEWFEELGARLRRVRVCCGDWSRVCGPSPTCHQGMTGVFLDPPYSVADRNEVYSHESYDVAHDVREWCIANGDNPKLRIALCGYGDEHDLPGWREMHWKAIGGYGTHGSRSLDNAHRERIWFSPACLDQQPELFQ